MAFLDIRNIAIKGIAACVPSHIDTIDSIYKWDGKDNFISSTGIVARRSADERTTSVDLSSAAADKLIEELGWDKKDIDALIFVSQTPDYILPASSCVLQQKLGLSKDCYTLDISLGCSGWVYAMSVLTALLQNGTMRKGLLLAGDTLTKMCSSDDKSTYPLFGDAGSATAIEYDETSSGFRFMFNTDGSGYETIIIRDGAYRNPLNEDSLLLVKQDENISRRNIDLELNGMDVFSFGITKAPKSVRLLCEHFDIDMNSVDIFSFHQANKMMNEMIRKKLKIKEDKVPYCLDDFGNTSCASIPLVLVVRERENLRNKPLKHVACGFGVGLSWGSIYFETNSIIVPELIEI